MKFLCKTNDVMTFSLADNAVAGLHGMGTNAEILATQTASFRAQLPSHFAFEFLEGQEPCSAADGVEKIYPGPYLCWYESPPSMEKVAEAHKTICEIIEEDGPFDAVLA
jgi:hypothetical protein